MYIEAKSVDGVDLVLWPDGPIMRAFCGVDDEADWAWMRERLRPHPWRTFTDPLRLHNPEAVASLPRTVINCPARSRRGRAKRWIATTPATGSGKSTPATT
jgi:hypothetical protein